MSDARALLRLDGAFRNYDDQSWISDRLEISIMLFELASETRQMSSQAEHICILGV